MKILAFDTCFGACSAALIEADGERAVTRASRHVAMQRGHAEVLLPMIDAVLTEAGETCASLNRIAVTNGPGTFTGVRVGIAAARALALATGCPLVAIGTLEAIASAVVTDSPLHLNDGSFAVAIDARRDQVYLQAFEQKDGKLEASVAAPAACDLSTALDIIPAEVTSIVGSGGPLIADADTHRYLFSDIQPNAIAVARLAAFREPDSVPVSPLYLRPPDAKPQHGFALERAP